MSRHNDVGLAFTGSAQQELVADATRGGFKVFLFLRDQGSDIFPRDENRQCQTRRQRLYKRFVGIRFCAAQLMIEMGDEQVVRFFPAHQRIQQRRRVGTAGHGNQKAIRFRNVQLAQTRAQFFFQLRHS